MNKEDNIDSKLEIKENIIDNSKKSKKFPSFIFFLMIVIIALLMGGVGAIGSMIYLSNHPQIQEKLGLKDLSIPITKTDKIVLEESSAITDTVNKVSPAVVSISSTKNTVDLFGRSYEQKGSGTGFIITSDGLIITNKHVVEDESAIYQVFTPDGKNYEAKIIAKDPYYDLAVLKIEAAGLPTIELGDSDKMNIGQWVIAIGNALGEFQNTVTVGVISAKERQITATKGLSSETLEGLLQTDTAINLGNSGGPLVNLSGQVIGINVAVAGDAQGIGFAIPINSVKKAIESIKKTGEIKRPMLGVRYIPITKEIAKLNNLDIDYGAWILPGASRGEVAVMPGSPADKSGIIENDIILEINDIKIDEKNSLAKIISQLEVGDEIFIKILHKGENKEFKIKLDEAK